MFSLTYALRGFQDQTAQVFDVTAASLTERRPCRMLLARTARLCTMEDMLSTLEDEISLRTGRAVKQRREAAGFSLRMLAARSGISSSMISDIERGTKSPTVTTMVRLAEALGVSAATLVGEGTGPARRIHVLRRGEGAGGQHPAPWESLGPAASGSRIDFVRYQIPPSTVLGPSAAHACWHGRAYARGRRHCPRHRGRRNG